jgi:biopolymer transport protein ExbB/TolQ
MAIFGQTTVTHGDGFSIIKAFMQFSELGAEWVMYLLMALGAVMVGLLIARIIFFQKRQVDLKAFGDGLIDRLGNESDETGAAAGPDLVAALSLCGGRNTEAMEKVVVKSALEVFGDGPTVVEQTIESTLVTQRQLYEKHLTYFGTLGNNAPFIGLFGTVIGIIVSFQALGKNPKGGLEVVGPGIAEALVATAVGLLIAIPAVVIFNVFKAKTKTHVGNTMMLAGIVKTWAERWSDKALDRERG